MKQKPFEELTLLDRFLFAELMEDTECYQALLEVILNRKIHLEPPQTEKEFREHPRMRSIRVDVWGTEEFHTVYSTDVQQKNTHNIPKRSRFYRGEMDTSLLEPGEIDFNKLPASYVIFIAPFDLFGQGKYYYSFEMRCKENPELSLGDEQTVLFLNTNGQNDEEVRPELVELLHYIEHTNEMVESKLNSEQVKCLKDKVSTIKESKERRVEYMQLWEEKEIVRREGLAEGRMEGREEGREEGERLGIEKGERLGIEKGERLGIEKLVTKMLRKNIPNEQISQMTDQPIEYIQQIQEKMMVLSEEADYKVNQ